jgi:hypothetical protein
MIRIASWGAGLQSTTMIAMSALGELEPLDHVVHCDLGWERTETVAARDWYTDWYRQHGINVTILETGDIRRDGARAHVHIPFWTETGGPIRRQCTRQFKIRPVRRFARTLIGRPPTSRETPPLQRLAAHPSRPPNPPAGAVEQWLGITTDEFTRAKASEVEYIINRWPLLEKRMTRDDCTAWLHDHSLPVPVKSACVICPYRRADEWIDIRDNEPEQFRAAIAFDEKHRDDPRLHRDGLNDSLYIWQGIEPLATADLEASAARDRRIYGTQLPLFACESGYCGI